MAVVIWALLRTFSPDWWETHAWKLDLAAFAQVWWETIGSSVTDLPFKATSGSFRGCHIAPIGFHLWIFALPT
jgi:hypothetical protein